MALSQRAKKEKSESTWLRINGKSYAMTLEEKSLERAVESKDIDGVRKNIEHTGRLIKDSHAHNILMIAARQWFYSYKKDIAGKKDTPEEQVKPSDETQARLFILTTLLASIKDVKEFTNAKTMIESEFSNSKEECKSPVSKKQNVFPDSKEENERKFFQVHLSPQINKICTLKPKPTLFRSLLNLNLKTAQAPTTIARSITY